MTVAHTARQPNTRKAALRSIRPMLQERGVLWGRACLTRYSVEGFSSMTIGQLARLSHELSVARALDSVDEALASLATARAALAGVEIA
jgi:hypothetical protein